MDDVLVEVEVFTQFFQPSTCFGSGDFNINVYVGCIDEDCSLKLSTVLCVLGRMILT